MKNPIGWIEIPVTDLGRAEAFYQKYFGFELQRQDEVNGHIMSWFPMDTDSYGAAATLIYGPDYAPSHDGPLIYFTAPDDGTVESGVQKAEKHGIKVLTPKTSIGEHGFFAVIEDSEGNRIAIHSMKG